MRNLKKVLTLVLTLAMLLSVMVVGAGAATFGDQESITNKEAVDVCTTLNIIGGYEDGTFRPTGNVTRAEMCKMICVALNGGKEPNMGSNLINTFNDVAKDHWAAPYVEYCVSQGIVGGVGGGNFNPNGNITGTQAAKMLLCILGYNASIQGYVGNDFWETKINVDAAQKGLYEGLAEIDASAALTRDQAAQMIWNGLQADEVEYVTTLVPGPNGTLTSQVSVQDRYDSSLNKKIDLLSDKYGVIDTDDTTGIITGISYNSTKDQYTYSATGVSVRLVTDKDYTDLLGQEVTFVVKDNNDKDIYGAFVGDSEIAVSGLWGDVTVAGDNSNIEVDDVEYKLDSAEVTVTSYNVVAAGTGSDTITLSSSDVRASLADAAASNVAPGTANFYDQYKAIDKEGDGDIDYIIVYPVTHEEVSYVGSDYVRVGGAQYGTDADEWVVDGSVAKDDYVSIVRDTSLKTYGTITAVDKQTGDLERISGSNVTLDGSVYKQSYLASALTSTDLNDSFDFYVINGYVVKASKGVTVDVSKVLVATANSVNRADGYAEVGVVFSDGTEDIVTLKDRGDTATADTFYTYTVSNGRYDLTAFDISAFDFDDYAATGTSITNKNGSTDATVAATLNTAGAVTGLRFDENAVVFVKNGADWSVENGTKMSKFVGTNATVANIGVEKNDNGYNYVTFAVVTSDSWNASSDTSYGFVTSKVETYKNDDGDTYHTFSAWNGTEPVTLTANDDEVTGTIDEKAVISYEMDGDYAVNVNVITGTPAAVLAFDGEKIELLTATNTVVSKEIDADDTTVLFVDYAKKTGEVHPISEIRLADDADSSGTGILENSGDYYYVNVLFDGAGTTLDLIVVDVTNDWGDNR